MRRRVRGDAMTDTFPLQWPAGWPRTKRPASSRFEPASVSYETSCILHELRLLGARNIVINSNMHYKSDGTPYTRQARLEDPGVAVYFTLNDNQQCIPCDRWRTVEENMRAIWKTIEALRGIERWGAKDMVNAAFQGFKALPENVIVTPYTARPWYEVLQVSPDADKEIIRAAWKRLIARYHPDNADTGDVAKFHEVQQAYKDAQQ